MCISYELCELAWLIGRWVSFKAKTGFPPSAKIREFRHVIEFTDVGKPMLKYVSQALEKCDDKPIHFETGFLIPKDGEQICLIATHNSGYSTVEEGCLVNENFLILQSAHVNPMSWVKRPMVTQELCKLSWLAGRWVSLSARFGYPTYDKVKKFEHIIEFTYDSYPMLNYVSTTFLCGGKSSHFESGYLAPHTKTDQICLLAAHSLGYATVEEGTLENENLLVLETTFISPMTWVRSPLVTKLQRSFSLCDDKLIHVQMMETECTPLSWHVTSIFEKESC